MLPPAAEAAVAAGADDRPATAFFGDEDELDYSEEEEEEEETDDLEDEEVEDDEDDEDRKPPVAASAAVVATAAAVSAGVFNGSFSPSTSYASDPAAAKIPNPNPNGNPAAPGRANASPSLNGAAAGITAVQAAASRDGGLDGPDRKRQRTESASATAATAVAEEKKPLAALEDSRRLFQRLFTDEDEIAILQGFLDFTSQRSAAAAHHAHHHDTGPFYDQIRTRLQLDFNKNQLVEKLRRLKKKYRNIMSKMGSGKEYAFKSPHDQATFELSRKIWGNSIYSRGGGAGPDDDDDDDPTPHHQVGGGGGDDHGAALMTSSDRKRIRRRGRRRSIAAAAAAAAAAEAALPMTPEAPVDVKVAESHMPTAMASVPNVIEETVRSCLSPLFKELLYCAVGGAVGPGPASGGGFGGLGLSPLPLNVGNNPVNLPNAAAIDDKWRKQQILELEVYSKRIELVQEQIKLLLEELRK